MARIKTKLSMTLSYCTIQIRVDLNKFEKELKNFQQ